MSTASFLADGEMVPLRVLIVTEVRLFRDGLSAILSRCNGIEVVAATGANDEMTALLNVELPQLVLVDALLVRYTDVIQRISKSDAGAKVVAFAVAEQDDEEVLACAQAGVAGLVAREASVNDLLQAMRTAVRGEVHCSSRVVASMIRHIAGTSELAPFSFDCSRLTRREIEIVELIDQGLSNKEIASRLGIETATVKNHVHNLLEKLQVHRRGEAAAALRTRRRVPIVRRPRLADLGARAQEV